jgi:integrase
LSQPSRVRITTHLRYKDEELDALFSASTWQEALVYRFFLETGLREQEVMYLAPKALDLKRKTPVVIVQAKPRHLGAQR